MKYIILFILIVLLILCSFSWYRRNKNIQFKKSLKPSYSQFGQDLDKNIQFKKSLKPSYSQFGQDLDIIEFLNHKQNGYFIDIGAADGIDLSNTYLLENKYNWNGICIEPQNFYYKHLIKNRNCHTDNSLLFSEKGKVFNFSLSNNGLAGITDYIDKHHHVKNSKQTKKTTDTLNNILIKYNAPRYIDYVSLDTEGSELEILKGIDFNKYKIGIMNIEHNFVEPRRTNIRKFLENNGYKFYKEKDVDDFYISK
jgi:FkbM family methyltransferase